MSSDEVLKIIEALPRYIQYFFPGYLTIYLYLFFRSLTFIENKANVIKAISISYIYVVILQEIVEPFANYILPNSVLIYTGNYKYFLEILALILMSVLFAYISYRVISSDLLSKFLLKINIRTSIATDELNQLERSTKDGTLWLCIYLKDSDIAYEGFVYGMDLEDNHRNYICLSRYRKYFIDEDRKPVHPYIEDHDDEPEEKVIIYYPEISIIEKRKTE